ncbi:helix-turn-helix domain-containing protein [Paenibacillus yanchengensis]|uniref:Helix-turn-helix domain-containing protein n=1 Tax=Paenibacillus yanchengensis TaxID=2035833 RepID=A0ABW4YKY5_9BACL
MLGSRLKNLRTSHKLTQKQLAEKVNVTHVSISGYESGNRSPDTETLQSLADFFDVSVDYLLGRTDDSSTSANSDKPSNSGRAYLDGGKDWTEEEIQAADDFIKLLRKKRKQ